MPVRKTKGGGYKYGSSGKTYYGKGAKGKAAKQGRAIQARRKKWARPRHHSLSQSKYRRHPHQTRKATVTTYQRTRTRGMPVTIGELALIAIAVALWLALLFGWNLG
jgi:hypothetical protein